MIGSGVKKSNTDLLIKPYVSKSRNLKVSNVRNLAMVFLMEKLVF